MPASGTAYLEEGEPCFVLLADPDTTLLAPLMEHMLLAQTESTATLWQQSGWAECTLRQVLPAEAGVPAPAGLGLPR